MSHPLSLDDLINLNRELLGLCRAGVPLGGGLRRVAGSLAGAAAPLANRLADRIEAGVPLPDALRDHRPQLPEAYLAIVRTAWAAGDPAAGLESFSTLATRQAAVRRAVWLSAVYPLVLCLLGWSLAVYAVAELLPVYAVYDPWLSPLVGTLRLWLLGPPGLAWVLPSAGLLAALLWTVASRHAGAPGWGGPIDWGPIARTRRLAGEAHFVELLDLLLSRLTPLPEALRLAAAESGGRQLRAASEAAAAAIESGRQPDWQGLPPLVRIALATPATAQSRRQMVASAAAFYGQRIDARIELLQACLPELAVVVVGGAIVVAVAAVTLWPYVGFLYRLADPTS